MYGTASGCSATERPQLWEEMGKVWDDVSTFDQPQFSVIVYDSSLSGGLTALGERNRKRNGLGLYTSGNS